MTQLSYSLYCVYTMYMYWLSKYTIKPDIIYIIIIYCLSKDANFLIFQLLSSLLISCSSNDGEVWIGDCPQDFLLIKINDTLKHLCTLSETREWLIYFCNFNNLKLTWRPRMGCRRSRITLRRKFLILVLDMLETFWVWGIIWDHPFNVMLNHLGLA